MVQIAFIVIIGVMSTRILSMVDMSRSIRYMAISVVALWMMFWLMRLWFASIPPAQPVLPLL